MAQTSASHVFMSYSRRDEAVMQRIASFLRNQDVNIWVDNEKLVPGTPIWEAEIEKAIRTASAVIVILSPDSKNSEWVLREITLADQHHTRIFPVLARGDEDSSITLRLITRQYVDIRQNEEGGLYSLKIELSRYLKDLETQKRKAREEAERLAREKAEREAAEKAAREKAERELEEKAAREKTEREAVEKTAREKAEHEAMEKAIRKKVEREYAERIAREKFNIEHNLLKEAKRSAFWSKWIVNVLRWLLHWGVGWAIGLALGWAIGEGLTDFTIMTLGETIGLDLGWAVGGFVGEILGGFLAIIILQTELNFSKNNFKNTLQSLARGFKSLFREPLQLFRSIYMNIKNALLASSNSKMLPGIGLGWYFSGALGWAITGVFGWVIGWITGGLIILFIVRMQKQGSATQELSFGHQLRFSWKSFFKAVRVFLVIISITALVRGSYELYHSDWAIAELVLATGIGFYYGFLKLDKTATAKQPIENYDSTAPYWIRFVSHMWGFIGFLIWSLFVYFSLIFLITRIIPDPSDFPSIVTILIFVIPLILGIERWNPWKNTARQFLANKLYKK